MTSMIWSSYRGVATAVLLAGLTAAPDTPLAAGLLPNGDFEAGFLIGWIAAEERDGIADLVTAGDCFATEDTTRLTLFGEHAAILRSGPSGRRSSVGILTSEPFPAGDGIVFASLTGTREGKRIDRPVEFEVRILDEQGGVLSAHEFHTSVVRLAPGCPGQPRDGRFFVHYVDTRPFVGSQVRIQFRQNTNTSGYQPFTLIDQVILFGPGEGPLFASKPIAVAGTSETRRGDLRLDASHSVDPDEGPLALTYRWHIDGEDQYRLGEYPCVADLADGDYRTTLYANDGFHAVADVLRFTVEGNGDGVGAGDDDQQSGDPGGDGADEDDDATVSPRVFIDGCDNKVLTGDGVDSGDGGDGENGDDGDDETVGDEGITSNDGGDNGTPPTVDLDADDTTDGGNNYRTALRRPDEAVPIAGNRILVVDSDGDSIESATIILENPNPDSMLGIQDSLSIDPAAVPASIGIERMDADSIVLSGRADPESYRSALSSVRFSSSSLENATPRIVRVTVSDGGADSSAAFATIAIDPE